MSVSRPFDRQSNGGCGVCVWGGFRGKSKGHWEKFRESGVASLHVDKRPPPSDVMNVLYRHDLLTQDVC